jgi:putative ABC transport system permease protein
MALSTLTARLSRVGGRVAVQHLVAERTRSANTLALVMLVMAMIVAVLAIYSSFTTSLDEQLKVSIGDTLSVESAGSFDDAFLRALDDVPGVAATTPSGSSSTVYVPADTPEESVLVSVMDPATYFDVITFPFVEGAEDDARDALATGRGVIVPAGLADRHGLHVGDQMVLQTIEGEAPFTVAAVAKMSNLPAEIVVGREAGPALGVMGIDSVYVRPAEGITPDALRDRIAAELGDRAKFLVVTADEYRADTRGQIGGGVNSFFVLLALAAVVGTFGLANTMAVSVTQRVREIGVLRAIGARRRHIRAMAAAEALTLVGIALVLALPLGLALAAPLMEATRQQLGDLTVEFHVPWTIVPVMACVGAAVAVGAAAWPARRAVHIEIDEAMRFE